MKLEKQFLIHDLLDDSLAETQRDATLRAGSRILRHKRWRRAALRALPVLAVIVIGVLALRIPTPPRQMVRSPVLTQAPAVHHLTDDQLLALFPNTPVGLATVAGRKVLIFPRAADREKYVGSF